MADLSLRPAALADADVVAKLSMALYAEHPGPVPMTKVKVARTLAHFAKSPESGSVRLVLRGGDVVGFVIVARHWSNEYGGFMAILDELYVVPDARGGGLGTQVLALVEAEERAAGSGAIMLEVDDDNPRARRLYERIGYALTGRHHLRKAL